MYTLKSNAVRNNPAILCAVLCMVFMGTSIFAETKEWRKDTTGNGKILVESNIYDRTDENGKELPVIEYVATTTEDVNIQNCISVIKDLSKHKDFLQDIKVSKTTKNLSENESIIYYGFDAPMAFADYDCVNKMTVSEDTQKKVTTFSLVAAPTMFEKVEKDRLIYYFRTFVFEDLGNGKVKITVTAKMSPLFKVPLWMLRASMPKHPTEVIQKIIKLSKQS